MLKHQLLHVRGVGPVLVLLLLKLQLSVLHSLLLVLHPPLHSLELLPLALGPLVRHVQLQLHHVLLLQNFELRSLHGVPFLRVLSLNGLQVVGQVAQLALKILHLGLGSLQLQLPSESHGKGRDPIPARFHASAREEVRIARRGGRDGLEPSPSVLRDEYVRHRVLVAAYFHDLRLQNLASLLLGLQLLVAPGGLDLELVKLFQLALGTRRSVRVSTEITWTLFIN